MLDEPTDLPEGEVIEMVPVEEVFAGGVDALDDEERERLHESLRESIRQTKDGETWTPLRRWPSCAHTDDCTVHPEGVGSGEANQELVAGAPSFRC